MTKPNKPSKRSSKKNPPVLRSNLQTPLKKLFLTWTKINRAGRWPQSFYFSRGRMPQIKFPQGIGIFFSWVLTERLWKARSKYAIGPKSNKKALLRFRYIHGFLGLKISPCLAMWYFGWIHLFVYLPTICLLIYPRIFLATNHSFEGGLAEVLSWTKFLCPPFFIENELGSKSNKIQCINMCAKLYVRRTHRGRNYGLNIKDLLYNWETSIS